MNSLKSLFLKKASKEVKVKGKRRRSKCNPLSQQAANKHPLLFFPILSFPKKTSWKKTNKKNNWG